MAMKKRSVYLDHNATTPLHPQVKKALVEAMEVFGNPSSLHSFGRQARAQVERAREDVALFIGAQPEEIIFTGSGSEASNTILSMFACASQSCASDRKGRTHLITTAIEHPCVLETSKCLGERGMGVSIIGVDRFGLVKIDELKEKLTRKTGLVSVMTANNEIGTIQDIKKIASIVHAKGALLYTDAVQAVGKIPIDVKNLGVDFLTLSGHKIYGPKGIGVLYVKKGTPFCPFIRGGQQERGRRAGTENTLGIIGLGKAIQMRAQEMGKEEKRLCGLKKRLSKDLLHAIDGIYFNGHPRDSLAGTLNVSFDGVEGEAILLYLDMEGIAVSTGSACASGSLDPSHVLRATGMPIERAHGSIRISMGRSTTGEDIDYVVEKFPAIIQRLRSMSSAYVRRGR